MNKILLVSAFDILNAGGDIERFICACAENGATGIRIFASYAWGYNPSTLFKELCKWDAGYPGQSLPFYDLEQPNEFCWDRLALILENLKRHGLGISIDLHDFSSLKQDQPAAWAKYFYPWLGNIQRHNNPRTERTKIPDGFWSFHPKWRELQLNYVKNIMGLVSTIGVEATYRVMNEYSILGWGDQPTRSWEWYRWFTGIMNEVGIWKERIIASHPQFQDRSPRKVVDAGLAKYISKHGYVKVKPIDTWGLYPSYLMLSGDGGFDGAGRADAKGRRGLGVDDARLLAEELVRYDYAGYEFLDRGLYLRNNDRANLDDFDPAPLRVMAETFGTLQPPPPPPPPPIDKKKEIYRRLEEIKELVKEI